MDNDQVNLNTEPNDIAGNRIDGPVGNTATQHTAPGAGTGQPGGPPASQKANPAGTPDVSSPAAPASSESLAASETSVGQGAVEDNPQPQENKEADPADLVPAGAYGGNFSNSTQDSFNDQGRRDNQDTAASRGEFGTQGEGGTTHGGFGNQNRLADYEPRGSAEDQYYGGPGAPGPQDNAYRRYDGHDQRPDARTEYGFEAGNPAGPAAGQAAETGRLGAQSYSDANGDNRNLADRADANSAFQNDNGAPKGPDSGFAADYGHTSLRGAAGHGAAPNVASPAASVAGGRNQTEDYLPTPADTDNQGRAAAPAAAGASHGQQPASSEGYGDRGREQPRQTPDFATGDERNGYVQGQANKGDAGQGMGSRGGSYNDAYDDSQPGSKAGSPAQGEQRTEDRARNYGQEARHENRPDAAANDADHGAPRRNAGRDGEANE